MVSMSDALDRNAVPNGVDVIILVGQSQLQTNGRILSELPAYVVADASIKIWDRASASWQTYNATVNSDQPGNIGAQTGPYWGPEAIIGYQYRQRFPRRTLYIIKAAIPGTQLFQSADGVTTMDWHPLSSASELLGLANVQVQAALAALTAANIPYKVRAVIWGQGEADAGVSAQATLYKANLQLLYSYIRKMWCDDHTKFIIARMKRGLFTYYQGVFDGYNALAASDSRVVQVYTDTLVVDGGGVHYTAASLEQFGLDLFTAIFLRSVRQNYVANGDFAADILGWTAWTFNGSTTVLDPAVASWSSGKARLTNAASKTFSRLMIPIVGLTVGLTYAMKGSFTYSGNRGRLRISSDAAGNVAVLNSDDLDASAEVEQSFVATASNLFVCLVNYNSNTSGVADFDNVQVLGP